MYAIRSYYVKLSTAERKLPIGTKLTGGLGAGGNPEIGQNAAIESTEELRNVLRGSDMRNNFV